MQTISAKELRDNLHAVTKRVGKGEHIYVTYRNKPAFKLEPPAVETKSKKRFAGLEAILAATKELPVSSESRSVKTLYREHLDEKYGPTKR